MNESDIKVIKDTINNKLNELVELSKITDYHSIDSVYKITDEISTLEQYMQIILLGMRLKK